MNTEKSPKELISGLPKHQQIALFALNEGKKSTKKDKNELYFLIRAYETYLNTCKKLKIKSNSPNWFREYTQDLETLGIIE